MVKTSQRGLVRACAWYNAGGIASGNRKVERAERRYGVIMYVRKCMHNVMREHMRMDVGRLGYLQSIS